MMNTICEACEIRDSSIVEDCDDPKDPYHLCVNCHNRLHDLALRPLEWYNLAKRHGWFQFLLHDDFYDEGGKASQPKVDVERPDQFPAPKLSLVQNDADLLLDFSITQWNLEASVESAWASISKTLVLSSLQKRFFGTNNLGIRSRILEISASTLGKYGSDFVRAAWNEYPQKVDLISLSEASASCLPHREGFDKVLLSLNDLKQSDKRDSMFALAFFNSTETLDWIENNIFSPITESWAYLAAASSLSWRRVAAWLAIGRPMSLVAIDALRAFQRLPTPYLKKRKVELINPPTETDLKNILEDYIKRDNVPRVKQRIAWILEDVNKISKNG